MTIENMPTADRLRDAALISVRLPVNPESGYRPDDPLHELIPGDGQADAEILALVKFVTGREIRQGAFPAYLNTAPAARAALRRWAVLNPEYKP